jgi:hypothetical protein
MTQPLIWHTKKVRLCDLKDYEHNPRRISKKDFERLVNDIKQDGYHNRIIVSHDNTILGGHSRKKALLSAGYRDTDMVEVLYPSRDLSEVDIRRLNIRDNLPFGEFDFDILANHFDTAELIEWGAPESWFDITEADEADKPTKESTEELPGNLCAKCPYKEGV